VVIALCGLAAADAVDALATDDPVALAAAVATIEHGADPDALYAAGRACEDKLHDPVRALALYDRVLHEFGTARVAAGAEQHADHLRAQIAGGHAAEARAFSELIGGADHLPVADVLQRGDALAHAAWPGAAEASVWLAEWQRRRAIAHALPFADADARFGGVISRFPGTPEALRAATGRAGTAIDARAWDRAEALIGALPATNPDEVAVRDDLRAALARGRFHARLYTGAWGGLVLAIFALLASLLETCVRGGLRRPALRPPFEIWFLGPVALVLAIASFTANQAIAPAVLRIAIAGIVLAWISGATLDLLRARGRRWRLRAALHIGLCAIGVCAIAYIAVTGNGLLDMLIETVKFGPDV